MGLIDLILNLAGVLLWLGWRSFRLDPLGRTTPATLIGTLRRAEPRRLQGWQFLVGLSLLLVLRSLLYRHVAFTVDWTPKLDLFFVVLAFPAAAFPAVLVYSVLSFIRILLVCCFWGLALLVLNRGLAESDPLQRMLRQQFGFVARWPRWVQVLLPLAGVTLLWMALHPLLVYLGISSPGRSVARLAEQGLLLGLALFLTLQYLLPLFLLLSLVASYVYLGANPLWDFVSATAANLLRPMRGWPLRLARFDFSPMVGVLLLLLLLHWLPNFILARLAENHVALWPQ